MLSVRHHERESRTASLEVRCFVFRRGSAVQFIGSDLHTRSCVLDFPRLRPSGLTAWHCILRSREQLCSWRRQLQEAPFLDCLDRHCDQRCFGLHRVCVLVQFEVLAWLIGSPGGLRRLPHATLWAGPHQAVPKRPANLSSVRQGVGPAP